MTPKERERRIKHEMDRCVHFNGIQHEKCRADINLRALVGGADLGWAGRLPCFISDADKCEVACEQRKFLNRAEAEAEVQRKDEAILKTLAVIRAAHEHAKEKGYKVGNGGRDQMDCPAKCGGTLHYSVSSINGRMHGRCTTDGCAQWME